VSRRGGIEDRDTRANVSEGLRDDLAEPGRTAGDHRHLAVETELRKRVGHCRNTEDAVAGSAVTGEPSTRASAIALAMAAPRPGLPHSPRPRRPSGFVFALISW